MTGSGGVTGNVNGKDDTVPPSGSMQSQDQPQNQPQDSTPPVQQQ
jgi:hypothetical protein